MEHKIDSSAENVKGIMREICKELEQATGGKVLARFEEVKLKTIYTGLSGNIEMAAKLALARGTQETIDENALDREDASRFYDSQRYAFDIFNDNYRYRPFEVSVGALYPIKMFVDRTIVRESQKELSSWLSGEADGNVVSIDGDDDLRECLKAIINSRKMVVILQRLVTET